MVTYAHAYKGVRFAFLQVQRSSYGIVFNHSTFNAWA